MSWRFAPTALRVIRNGCGGMSGQVVFPAGVLTIHLPLTAMAPGIRGWS
jgi:hypothetical protein